MNQKSNKSKKIDIDVVREIKRLANQEKSLDSNNKRLNKNNDLHIRIYSAKLLKKLNIWKEKIKAENLISSNKQSINTLLSELLEKYLDSSLSWDLYELNKEKINSAFNDAIFKRNFGLIEYINKVFIQLIYEIRMIDIKNNILLNQILTKEQKTKLNFLLTDEIDWLKDISKIKLKETENEFEIKKRSKQ